MRYLLLAGAVVVSLLLTVVLVAIVCYWHHHRPQNDRIRRGFPDVESILDRSELPLMGPHTPIRDIIELTSSGSGSGKANEMLLLPTKHLNSKEFYLLT
ncbi:hypothetical protein E2C01_095544 [Portunus trituberculatus]|uniref:Uncharacterized protein n=1 Tax=Portunus trituberculatus TaxID=210409 RepID=A0A5B7K0F5_PORTR|nr:hypothetical protein [Portunus trituberculatus]